MLKTITLLMELAVAASLLWGMCRLNGKRLGRVGRGAMALLIALGVFVSLSVAAWAQPERKVTVTALDRKNEAADSTELTLSRLLVNGQAADIPEPVSGQWSWYSGEYRWFMAGDERMTPGQTESVSFTFPVLDRVELVFAGNRWKGIVELEMDGQRQSVDTYRAEGQVVTVALSPLPAGQALRGCGISVAAFAASMLAVCILAVLVCMIFRWVWSKTFAHFEHSGPIKKLLSYQFLFEELVKRDFKKKYKRTVLGMAWSVLSPLLTLLVMRLVFTQFFGRNTAHYTTYLFCGNLIFSYFNESTSQGMTSLMGNSHIFTKVNVPKYLFLFSKNVQTLINFGLTLCVFFVFCVLDNITFTWKFICLLYPIVCLVLFNIGVGLILSALFVFFRDIQYLWSVFTMLLMYMSAIFYTIDNYSPMAQNLFLLNPVYLFIRYFRKIVIDATIPSLWFHLLMLADVIIAVGLGFWMYKKNNTKFLYYV